jgi:hypothetical protein
MVILNPYIYGHQISIISLQPGYETECLFDASKVFSHRMLHAVSTSGVFIIIMDGKKLLINTEIKSSCERHY